MNNFYYFCSDFFTFSYLRFGNNRASPRVSETLRGLGGLRYHVDLHSSRCGLSGELVVVSAAVCRRQEREKNLSTGEKLCQTKSKTILSRWISARQNERKRMGEHWKPHTPAVLQLIILFHNVAEASSLPTTLTVCTDGFFLAWRVRKDSNTKSHKRSRKRVFFMPKELFLSAVLAY